MIVVQREALARLSKSERRKAEILVRWATELHGRRTRSSLADQRYASLAWALAQLGVVRFDDELVAVGKETGRSPQPPSRRTNEVV